MKEVYPAASRLAPETSGDGYFVNERKGGRRSVEYYTPRARAGDTSG
jgi:hypothetical protein